MFGIAKTKAPRLTTRSLLKLNSPSCLADYFPWPQVALTHHAKLSNPIEPHLSIPVNPPLGSEQADEFFNSKTGLADDGA
jgi:hypothetical protein